MIKVILVSDNHYNHNVIKHILNLEQFADYYLHCGDSESDIKSLKPFVSVLGNNDYDRELPIQRFIEIEGNRVMILHGNPYVSTLSDTSLVKKAKDASADIVMFGHTHVFADYTKEGIRFINPGSCNFNRDGTAPSYARIYIDKSNIKVERVDLDPKDYL